MPPKTKKQQKNKPNVGPPLAPPDCPKGVLPGVSLRWDANPNTTKQQKTKHNYGAVATAYGGKVQVGFGATASKDSPLPLQSQAQLSPSRDETTYYPYTVVPLRIVHTGGGTTEYYPCPNNTKTTTKQQQNNNKHPRGNRVERNDTKEKNTLPSEEEYTQWVRMKCNEILECPEGVRAIRLGRKKISFLFI